MSRLSAARAKRGTSQLSRDDAVEHPSADAEHALRVAAAGPAMLWRRDPRGRGTYANPRWLRFLGLNAEKARGAGWMHAIHPDDRTDCRDAHRSAASSGRPFEIDYRVRAADGGYRRVRDRGEPDRDDFGALVGFVGSTAEIEDPRRGEARLELALAATKMGLWDWHVPMNDVQLDLGWASSLGYDLDEIGPWFDFWTRIVHPDDLQPVTAAISRHFDGETSHYEVDHRLRAKDGQWHWIRVHGRVVERDDSGRPIRAIGTHQEITDHKAAEEALRIREVTFRLFVEYTPAAVAMVDREMRYLAVSRKWSQDYRLPTEELIGRSHYEVFPEIPERWKEIHRRCLAGATERCDREAFERADGTTDWVRWEIHPWRDGDGEVGGIVMFTEVLNERIRLEEQLRHADKMDAIGRLAGGIAHDFNNVLTAIVGYTELALTDPETAKGPRWHLDEIRHAADRAANLARQLLAFGRRQRIEPRTVDLNEIVRSTDRLLRPLIGEPIRIVRKLTADLGPIRSDPACLEQVIVNLAVNARDAMPRGGAIEIETARVDLTLAADLESWAAPAGTYAVLRITDTGVGMNDSTLARIFEPFFTTKPAGIGTGLGLSMVYGIVTQCGGYIRVHSRPGEGTRVEILLPLSEEGSDGALETVSPFETRPRGEESILLVEDEPAVRRVLRMVLERYGYRVQEARGPHEALAFLDQGGEVDLVLTDVVMPEMSGLALGEEIARRLPAVPVLYMSGYAADETGADGPIEASERFVPKPCSPARLLAKVREVLDGRSQNEP
ncbi:MAG: PAS domain-containing protein [Myxococcales bacterium]|nr:PAS domain-containing protein [Myxococcales bacterium]